MKRRRFLARTALVLAPIALSMSTSTAADDDMPTYESTGPVRGEADVDLEVVSEEDDEYVEYLEDEEVVEFVAAWGPSDDDGEREPSRVETMPWEQWAKRRCITAAASTAADYVAEELEIGDEAVGHGISTQVPGTERAAVVTVLVSDGMDDVAIDIDDLAATTPATVEATYVLDDRKYEYEAPIYVRLEGPSEEVDDLTEDDADPSTDDAGDGRTDEDDGGAMLDSLPGFGVAAAVTAVVTGAIVARARRDAE